MRTEPRGARTDFAYGAVYFRKTNPPRADWERDYAQAAHDGFGSFRHWFMWSAIEPVNGAYEWEDYDRQFALAARHGMTTIIAEHVAIAPEWVYRRYPDARYRRADGSRIDSRMQPSSAIAGSPGLCLDHPDVRAHAARFLHELAGRYHRHPAMGGYDIWNECNIDPEVCYCPSTVAVFRDWLRVKYGQDLSALRTAWNRWYGDWGEVQPPRELEVYGQSMDWLAFRQDRAIELMKWRRDAIRSVDAMNPITAHGIAGTLGWGISRAIDDWRAAEVVDSYGFTFVAARRGDEPWKQVNAVELVRSASRGKAFWHAEMQAGPLWHQPQVLGRQLDDGRVPSPEDVRYWNLVSMAGGVSGVYHLRWRPLLHGPLFQAFGAYGMDGRPTPRSEMVASIAQWARDDANRDLWTARPVLSGVSLLFVPESQAFACLLRGSTKPYEHAINGAWRGFFDAQVVAGFARADRLDEAPVLYLPYPMMLPDALAARLKKWVHDGGILISEGAPAWFGDHAVAGTVQPGSGLAELFGAREVWTDFAPDALRDLAVEVAGMRGYGGELRQQLAPHGGAVSGHYLDGGIAAVDNEYGAGRTRLIGTSLGVGYHDHEDAPGLSAAVFEDLLGWAGIRPPTHSTNQTVLCRLHDGPEGRVLWLLNPSRSEEASTIVVEGGVGAGARAAWGSDADVEVVDGERLRVRVAPRDALVLRLGRGDPRNKRRRA